MKLSPPRKSSAPNKWLSFILLACLLISPSLLQGCDTFGTDQQESEFENRIEVSATSDTKLRHGGLMGSATRTMPGLAGKTDVLAANLYLAFNPYEADGITPRLLNRYEVTNRILEEYGITRRVLSKYGITKRILDQYGITRRIVNKYGITKRVLDKYGLTPRLMGQYGDHITASVLAEYGITEAILAEEGLSMSDIEDFNVLSDLLNEFDMTVEQYINELESTLSSIRVKISIDGTHLGMSIALDEEVLDAFLEEIADDPDILFAEPDFTIDLSHVGMTSGAWYDKQVVPWGITQTDTPLPGGFSTLFADYVAKNPVHVYVLDSGAMQDTWFDDLNYVEKKDFTMLFENPDQLTWDEDLAPDVSGFDPGNAGSPYDESGHGTHIAGTIGAANDLIGVVGVAPYVKIHSLKVLTARGQTDITTLLAAVDYVTRAKVANPDWPVVVNMSLGVNIGTTSYNVLDEAIKASIEAGVIYVAASGNDGQNAANFSPAHVDEVITVGAYNTQSTFSPFSNYGSVVDILAPGEDIISLSHVVAENTSFETILASGTSHAAPHVTGAVARYLGSHPNATAQEIANALINSAQDNVAGAPEGTTSKALNVGALLADVTDSSNENELNWWSRDDDSGSWSGEESSSLQGGYVMDEFADEDFDGNDGTDIWAGDWTEIGEDDGAESGRIEIDESGRCADGYCLEIAARRKGRGIRRAADLAGVSSATLSFDYRRKDLAEANVHVEVSPNGGNSWTRLYTFSDGSDSSLKHKSFDISSYASSDTQIRFIVADKDGDNKVFIDNIKISY